MKKVFRKSLSWLLVIVVTFTPLFISAQNSFNNIHYYWLYSSAIPSAWNQLENMETRPVTVAVIDTGIDKSSAHFKGRIDSRGRNFSGGDLSDFQDKEGHGTAVSGIIAGLPTKRMNYRGVCGNLDVKILPLKIYNDTDGSMNLNNIIASIYYAIEMDVDVINISIDIPFFNEELHKACLAACEANIPIVAAAGNKGNEYYSYPSSFHSVISVAALSFYDDNYYLSSPFSSYNDRIDISAHGDNIFGLGIDNTYRFVSGSSFSCAIVTSAIAILKSLNKDLTSLEIKSLLAYSADNLSINSRNNYYGYGKLNLLKLINTTLEDLRYTNFNQEEEDEDTLEDELEDESNEDFSFVYQDYRDLLSSGLSFGLWINDNGTVSSIGDASFSKRTVNSWVNIKAVAAGDTYSVGLRSTGTLVATGFSAAGALTEVHRWSSIKQIATGTYHMAALTTSGNVLSAGNNNSGQCDTDQLVGVVSIDCGTVHTAALTVDRTVKCVGSNFLGECDTESWTDIVSIAAGNCFTIGLRADGRVVAAGNNFFGQLDVDSWTDIIEVFAGHNYTVGLKADGSVLYTGINNDLAKDISTLENIKTMACGRDLVIAFTNDDELVIYGNVNAQLRSTYKPFVSTYDDVNINHWAYNYITPISRLGILNGYIDGDSIYFQPENYITRAEFFKVIIEALGMTPDRDDDNYESLSHFMDLDNVDAWSLPYIKIAYEYGLLKGDADSQGNLYIYPKKIITRAQAITILGRAFGVENYLETSYIDKDKIPLWAKDAIMYYSYMKVLQGYPDNSIRPNDFLHRAEAATLIYKTYNTILTLEAPYKDN